MKRILRFLFIIVVLLFLAAWAFPLVFKDAIVERVKSEANANLKAELNFESVDLSLISSFPYLGFSLEELSLTGTGDFAGKTLLKVGDFGLKVDLMSVISGESYQINKISLEDVEANLHIDAQGRANFDILKMDSTAVDSSTETEAGGPFHLALQEYELSNIDFHFLDEEAGIEFGFKDLNHHGSGDFTQSVVALQTQTEIAELNFVMDGVAYLNNVQAQSDFGMSFHQEAMQLQFEDNSISLNELALQFKGGIDLSNEENIGIDLDFTAPQNSFKSLISLIPNYYYQDFEALETSGEFSLNGFVKGVLQSEPELYPSFMLAVDVDQGYVHYPDLPTAIEGLNLNLKVSNKTNKLENTEIYINQAKANIAGNPIEARMLLLDPMGDPDLDASFSGKMDLAKLMEVFPMPGYELEGQLDADFKLATKLSYVESEKYDQITAEGGMQLTSFKASGDSIPMPLAISTSSLSFSPQSAKLGLTKIEVANTDMEVSGSLDNMLSYALSDQLLRGKLNFYSQRMDLNDLMTEESVEQEESQTSDTVSLEVIRLPENIDFTLATRFDDLHFDSLRMRQVTGMMRLYEGKAEISDASMQTMGGSLSLKGYYDSKPAKPRADFDFAIKNCSFKETYRSLDLVKSIAPIMENMEGHYSAGLAFNSELDAEMSPDMGSLNGSGNLKTSGVSTTNQVMAKLASFLNNPNYESLTISDLDMDFSIENGVVEVKPVDFQLAGQATQFSGKMGLDQSLDFDLSTQLPLSSIKASSLQERFSTFSNGTIPLAVAIGGTATNPSVKPNFGDITRSLVNEVKEQVKAKVEETKEELKAEANKKLEELVAEAEARGDELIAEAENKAAQLKAEAKKQADKLREEGDKAAQKIMDEAGSNPLKKAAARPLADRAKQEAYDKAQDLENKAAEEADKLVEAAKAQKKKLIEDAQAKAEL